MYWHKIWHNWCPENSSTFRFDFWQNHWQQLPFFEIQFIGYNSVADAHVCARFDIWNNNNSPDKILPSDFTFDQIQYGRRHFKILLNNYNLVAVACIGTKFDVGTITDFPKIALYLDLALTKSKVAAAAILKFSFLAITHNSVPSAHIRIIFGKRTKNNIPELNYFWNIQGCGGRHFKFL